MLKTVICDDEAPALELMAALLTETGEVAVVAACQSVREAIGVINNGGIDLVVFDIEMPEISGVNAYAEISVTPRPLVVFATAHPEYAVEAFGVDAIDYVLKPLEIGRVRKAVEKASRLKRLIDEREKSGAVDAPDAEPAELAGVLKVKDAGKLYFIAHQDIVWIEAAGDYSLVHMTNREATIRVAIKALEADLPSSLFVRVHRSAIVAIPQIRQVNLLPKGEAQIVMNNSVSVRASRSYRETVRGLMAKD